jgi:site-specific DNA-methyltransferase (cytosine-N4-specific)
MTSLNGITFDFKDEDTSYLTHSLHPYPAKFPPQLPQRIMRKFMHKGMNVVDPFCGSGTTLVEARLQGINSVGVDINGLACLLSKVKSTPLAKEQIATFDQTVELITKCFFDWKNGNHIEAPLPTFDGLEHWFQQNVTNELAWIKLVITQVSDVDVSDLLKIVLASIVVQVSNQESDTRYAAISKGIKDAHTIKLFLSKCSDFRKKITELSDRLIGVDARVEVFNADARNLQFLREENFDVVITSPPYANTYDYYLYHKFRKRWLGLDVQHAQYNEIGSRREFSSLKQSPIKWTEDLKQCFSEIARVLKTGGLAFVVIGDSVIKKELIKIDEVVSVFAVDVGFVVQDVISSSLAKHSRVFNPAFTQKGKQEHLILLQKS